MSQHRPTYNSVSSRRTCECCVRAIKWIPVLFVFSIICWSYYAFVVQLCFLTVPSITEKIILLLLYHVICFLFLWSYYQTIFTEIAEVPAKFRLPADELEKLYTASTDDEQRRILETSSHNLPITNRTVNGAVRFCEKCHLLKPDRCHHCSVCGTCVLKMDHHCPWINSCVCFNNYKFFILFLGYALLYCIFVALTSLPYFVQFWRGQLEGMGRFHILFLFFVSVMFAISLVSLFGYHIYLVIVNRTTLEAFRPPIFRLGGPDKNGYSLGYYNNFQEVFGDDKRYWFLPVFTSLGDGVQYPVQTQHEVNFYYEPTNSTLSNDTSSNMPTREDITNFRLASAQNNHHNDFSAQHVINDKSSLQNNGSQINGTVVVNFDDNSVVQKPKSVDNQTSQSVPECRIDCEPKDQIRSVNHYDEVPSSTQLLNNDSIIHL